MKYAIYTRKTTRHKWRFASLMWTHAGARAQAQALATQNGGFAAVLAAAAEFWKPLPANTPVLSYEPTRKR